MELTFISHILQDKSSFEFVALASSTLFLSLLPYLIGMYLNLKKRNHAN